MIKKTLISLTLFSLLHLLCSRIASAQTPYPAPGLIHEEIGCRENSGEHYALYLPKAFDSGRSWPILICFDPGGRVMIPMNLLKEAAETGGYILACPDGVKNGPIAPSVSALSAVWTDLVTRLPIDGRRVYAVGFSGGARMASLFPLVSGQKLAGILACGAGLSQGVSAEQLIDTVYLGIVGFADFNYAEMVQLEQTLKNRARPSCFFYIDLPHQWPSAALCERAISLFEIQAMRDGLIASDPRRIGLIFQREIQAARERSLRGEVFFAAREAAGLSTLFNGLLTPTEMDDLLQQQKSWQDSKEFKRFQKEENLRLKQESETLGRAAQIFSLIRQGPSPEQNPVRLIAGLGLSAWVKRAAESPNPHEKGLASRILSALSDAARDETLTQLSRRNLEQAELAGRIRCEASRNSPAHAAALFDQGCIYARLGRKKEALKSLQQAIAGGLRDLKLFMEDTDLDSLRSSEAFQTLLKSLKK